MCQNIDMMFFFAFTVYGVGSAYIPLVKRPRWHTRQCSTLTAHSAPWRSPTNPLLQEVAPGSPPRGCRRRPATHGRPCACRVADLHHKLAPHPLQHADEGGRPLERGAFRLAAGAVAIRLQRPLLLDFMFRAAAEMASHDSTGWGQDAVDGRKTSARAVATAASAMEWEGGRLAGFGRERRCGWMGSETL